jgi:hypothetical protein
METLDQFFTDEFFRYSAECRRLGRLARRSQSEGVHGKSRAWVERLGALREVLMSSGSERGQQAFMPRPAQARR